MNASQAHKIAHRNDKFIKILIKLDIYIRAIRHYEFVEYNKVFKPIRCEWLSKTENIKYFESLGYKVDTFCYKTNLVILEVKISW